MNSFTARISYWLRNLSDSDEANPWIITSWHGVPLDSTNTDLVEATSGATPTLLWSMWWNAAAAGPAGTGGYRAALPTAIQWYRAESQWRLAPGQGDATGTSEYDVPSSQAGTRSGTIAPQPLALVLRKNVDSGLKKHRGRNYLPCTGPDVLADGQVVTASRTAVAAAMTPVLSNTVISGFYPLISAGSDGVNRIVSSFDVAPRIGVQRRRLQ